MVKSMKAVRFRFVSIKNFRWIGIYVFRTFTIPPIYDFFPKTFYRRTLVKQMANSFTRSITLFAFLMSVIKKSDLEINASLE